MWGSLEVWCGGIAGVVLRGVMLRYRGRGRIWRMAGRRPRRSIVSRILPWWWCVSSLRWRIPSWRCISCTRVIRRNWWGWTVTWIRRWVYRWWSSLRLHMRWGVRNLRLRGVTDLERCSDGYAGCLFHSCSSAGYLVETHNMNERAHWGKGSRECACVINQLKVTNESFSRTGC